MTVQFIRLASQGLPAGAIRILPPATEAALVADGEAIYTTVPNPAGDDLPVRFDPTTGMIVMSDGGPIAAQVALQGVVSGDAISATALIAPGDGVTLTTTVGAGATLDVSGTETIDGEQWRYYTITGISGSNNYVDVTVPTFAGMAADSAVAHWSSSVAASSIGATIYLGTAAFATSASVAAYMQAASATNYRGHTGMIGAPVAHTDWTKAGYSRDTLEQVWTTAKIRFQVTNGTTATIRLRSLYAGLRRRKGRICIIADDGIAAFFGLGTQILARYGLKSTAGIIADKVGTTSYYASEAELRRYVAAGNMCVAHGPVGGSGSLFSANATDAGAVADMQYHRDWLLARRLTTERGAACYVWPQGQWTRTAGDPAFLALAWAAGFRVARISDVQTTRFVNASQIASVRSNLLGMTLGHRYAGAANTVDDATETTNVADIITRCQYVAAAGLDSYLVLHDVVGRGAASSTVQIEADRLHTLAAALQTLVAAGTLECPTMDAFVPA